MTQQLTIKQKVGGVRDLLARSTEQIKMALPKHMTPERMLRITMTAIQRTPKLLDCDPQSLIGAVVQASEMGLEPSNVLGHAYLVPFRNHKTDRMEVQLIPGFKGLVDMARRSGNVSTIYAQVVYENDHFEFSYGLNPTCDHVPCRDVDAGKMIAAYAVCKLRDGGTQFEVMWKRQVDAIRDQSKAKNNGPWVSHYDEMAKKTVLRRLCKMLPVSVELQKMVGLDERADAGLSQGMQHVVDFALTAPEQPSTLDALSTPVEQPEPGPAPPPQEEKVDQETAGNQDMRLEDYKQAIEQAPSALRLQGLRDDLGADKVLNDKQIAGLRRSLTAKAKKLEGGAA